MEPNSIEGVKRGDLLTTDYVKFYEVVDPADLLPTRRNLRIHVPIGADWKTGVREHIQKADQSIQVWDANGKPTLVNVDPGIVEPAASVDPGIVEPAASDSPVVDPGIVEPAASVDPGIVEPAASDSPVVDPGIVEPAASVDPGIVEPAASDSPVVDPGIVEPA